MIVRLQNLIHSRHVVSGSATTNLSVASSANRTLKRQQQALHLAEIYYPETNWESHRFSGAYSRNHPTDFYYPNEKKKGSRGWHKTDSDLMRITSDYNNGNFQRSGVLPLIAAKFSSPLATVSTACCWSVWILLFWSAARGTQKVRTNFSHTNSWRSGIFASTVSAAIPAISMSSYSFLFADAFHPSASYSSSDHEKEKTKESNSSIHRQQSSKVDESDSLPEKTCDAHPESKGKPHPDDDRLWLFHFDSTPSTQDEAKTIAKNLSGAAFSPDTFCVTATSQSKGRGTTGRQWLGAPGNVFVTIGIPVDVWMTKLMKERKIPLTLLPLKMGELTASLVHDELERCDTSSVGRVTVKWPNDVLVDDKKISGTLIENDSNWFLIGIGINVAHAPTVPTTGANYGRPSVSLDEYCGSSSNNEEELGQKARDLGVQLALSFHQWIYEEDSDTAEMIVDGWKRWLNWDTELTMRNDADIDGPRRVVKLLDVLPDGRIKVANKGDGKEEILVSDYFI